MFYKICRAMKDNKKGFTLVELMVVVVIIGILAAIAVPVYNNTQDAARTNANAANLRVIDGAISMYTAEHTTLPEDAAAWEAALEGTYLQTWPEPPTGYGEYEIAGDPPKAGNKVAGGGGDAGGGGG